MDGCINNMWSLHTVRHFWDLKRKVILTHATAWMNLDKPMLREAPARHRRTNTTGIYFNQVHWGVRVIEAGSWMVVPRGWRRKDGEGLPLLFLRAFPVSLCSSACNLLPPGACGSALLLWFSCALVLTMLLVASRLISELCHCSPFLLESVKVETSSSRGSLRSLNFTNKCSSLPSFPRGWGHRNWEAPL